MKKIFLLNLIFISLISCDKILKDKNDSQDSEMSSREYIVGDDKDENGCVGSAGYTWSILKNDCIRVFEIGYRLNPIQRIEDEAVISAFIIFDEDKDRVELFLPNLDKSIILKENDKGIYKNENYIFDSNEFIIKIDNKKMYEAAKEQLQNINDTHEDIE